MAVKTRPHPVKNWRAINILGQQIHAVTIADVLERADWTIEHRAYSWCVTVHVDMLMKLRRDRLFREACDDADLVVADGMPLLWAARLLGDPLPEKVSGSDLLDQLAERAARRRHRMFFLGGQADDARRAAAILERRHPGLRVVGVHSPHIGSEPDEEQGRRIQKMIRESGADILIVGLGAPKQEKWIARWGRGSGVSFALGVGISFSFVAGTVKRAPRWMQRSGLEWLWRLSQEPRRLWRRYLIDDMPFFALIARQWLHRRRFTEEA